MLMRASKMIPIFQKVAREPVWTGRVNVCALPASHAGNRGSIPLGATIFFNTLRRFDFENGQKKCRKSVGKKGIAGLPVVPFFVEKGKLSDFCPIRDRFLFNLIWMGNCNPAPHY